MRVTMKMMAKRNQRESIESMLKTYRKAMKANNIKETYEKELKIR